MVTRCTIFLLLIWFADSIIYPQCTVNDSTFSDQQCRIEISKCTDSSCHNIVPQTEKYCPNTTSCSTLCSYRKQSNLCEYISSTITKTEPLSNSIYFIYCPNANKSPKLCLFNESKTVISNDTISSTQSSSTTNNDLVIRLDRNALWTVIILSIILLFGCIICCIAKIFWKHNKKIAIEPFHRHKSKKHDIKHSNNMNMNDINYSDEEEAAVHKTMNEKHDRERSPSLSHSESLSISNINRKIFIIKPHLNDQHSEPAPNIKKQSKHKTYRKSSAYAKHSIPSHHHQKKQKRKTNKKIHHHHHHQHHHHKKHYHQTNYHKKRKKTHEKEAHKYSHTEIEDIEHEHIENVTMIINNNNNNNNNNDDSMDSDIKPHIVNDEESYMHSLTLAQVENATNNHNTYGLQMSPNPMIPEIFPNPQNKKIMVVSNPFHIESEKTEDIKRGKKTKKRMNHHNNNNNNNKRIKKKLENNILIHPIYHDGDTLSDTNNGLPRTPKTFQLNIQNDYSTKVEITPRTPINSELLITPRMSMNTAIVHRSRNTFDESQTIDISTLKLTSNGSSENDVNDDEKDEDTTINTRELKNTLSDKIKKLQELKAKNDNNISYKTPPTMTSREETEETISMTSRQRMHHEYGISPSDLQEYFAMIAHKNNGSNHKSLISPTTNTNITHKKSNYSTDTETFYYKENQKNAEHHILMPALDEKDSMEYNTSTTNMDQSIHNTVDMMVVIDNTKEMNINIENIDDNMDIDNDNDKIITPQLIQKPHDGYIQEMRARLESTNSINDNNKNKGGSSKNLLIKKKKIIKNKNEEYDNNNNMNEIDLTLSIMSSTSPLNDEYRTSDEDVLHQQHSFTS